MNKTGISLLEGMERLGLMAARIRQNDGLISRLEIDIILQELRNLYVDAIQCEVENNTTKPNEPDAVASEAKHHAIAAQKAAEEKRLAEEAAARKAAEEKRLAEEAAAKKAAEEKRLAEEAAARKAAEEKRLAEEAAAKKAAEEELKPIFAPEPPEKEPAPVVEPMMEKIEGNRNDMLFAEESPAATKPLRKKQQETSLFDYFKTEGSEAAPRRTLADTLNQGVRNVEEQLESRVNAKKVDDLRTIININDKFSFMSELFHNNMKAYNDFILRLNNYTSREEALAFVSEIAAQNMWRENSLVVKSFYKIFDRKF